MDTCLNGLVKMMLGDTNKKIFEKVDDRINRFTKEYRFRIKDEEEREFMEEVFDKNTLLVIYKLMNRGYIEELYGVVSSGKEARIYSGVDKDGNPIAIKIFLTLTSEFRKSRMKYIYGDPRFDGLYNSPTKIIYVWASKEYKNLVKAYNSRVYVPKPIIQVKNVLMMEFIGDDFTPAPTLREYGKLSPHIFYQILRQVKLLYNRAGLIHADLSEYNIFYYRKKPILFDFGQAVTKEHPMAETFLIRDLTNIINFFKDKEIGIKIDLDEIIDYIKAN